MGLGEREMAAGAAGENMPGLGTGGRGAEGAGRGTGQSRLWEKSSRDAQGVCS